MKGLILHDLYLMSKYCKSFALIIAVFIGISCMSDSPPFLMIYSFTMASIIPVTLLSYDEREKWNVYSQTLPVSKSQYVLSKYIIGLIPIAAVVILYTITQTIVSKNIFADILTNPAIMTSISLLLPSILLPPIFWLGVEKGRIIYYVIMLAVAGFYGAVISIGDENSVTSISSEKIGLPIMIGIVILAICLYAVSYGISVFAYNRREI